MHDDLIASLALLKVNWDNRSDYIENFVPFAAECLRVLPQASPTLQDVQSEFAKRFGIKIPQEALKTILHRTAKRGFVVRKDNRYLKNERKLSALKFARSRDEALRRTKALVAKLQDFSKNGRGLTLTEEEAERELFDYLKERSEQLRLLTTESVEEADVRSHQVLVSSFIVHLVKNDPEGYGYLETVIKGAMLANALFFPSLSQIGQRFQSVAVYLDSNVLLLALGLAGKALSDPYRELIDLARDLGCSVCCFEQTVEEIRRVLTFVTVNLRGKSGNPDGFSSILEYCFTAGVSPSDVEILNGSLERELEKLGVTVRRKPAHAVPLSVDEKRLEYLLRTSMEHHTEEALRHDVDCLTAIHRLRGGQTLREIETCKALFVSTGQRFSQVSATFFGEHFGSTTAPHCMTAQMFTTIIWLKKPVRAQDLPMKKLVADCYAALDPSDSLWNRYLAEADRLRERNDISEEDYYQLRFSIPARSALMDLTLGNADSFDSSLVPVVLERARADARTETETALAKERERLGVANAKLLELHDRLTISEQRSGLSEQRLQATERRAQEAEIEARQVREALARREQDQILRISEMSKKVARTLSCISLVCGTGITGALVYFTLPSSLNQLPEEWHSVFIPALPAIFFVVGVLTLLNLSFGVTVNAVVKKWEVRVQIRLERMFRRFGGL